MCKIEFNLDEPSYVTVKVVDVMGTLVQTLMDAHKPAGHYNIDFSDEKLTPGKYYYKVFVGKEMNGDSKSKSLLKTGQVSINKVLR